LVREVHGSTMIDGTMIDMNVAVAASLRRMTTMIAAW
jgi:hypothetical protein